jgi:hypothetical protein
MIAVLGLFSSRLVPGQGFRHAEGQTNEGSPPAIPKYSFQNGYGKVFKIQHLSFDISHAISNTYNDDAKVFKIKHL